MGEGHLRFGVEADVIGEVGVIRSAMATKKKKVEPVNIEAQLKDFRRRWSIDMDDEARWMEFRERAMNSFADAVGIFFTATEDYENEYFRIIGVHQRPPAIKAALNDWSVRKTIASSAAYNLLFKTTSIPTFMERIQAVFWIGDMLDHPKEVLCTRLREDVAISGVAIAVSGEGRNTLLHPGGAKELDDALVNQVLGWLDRIPKAKERFATALTLYGKPGHARDVADNLRLSLELTLRHVLQNSKSLENQQAELGSYLKAHGIAPEIANSYWQLVNLYSKFQNDRVKHGDKVLGKEVELVLYLTGTFIRFLVSLE